MLKQKNILFKIPSDSLKISNQAPNLLKLEIIIAVIEQSVTVLVAQ